MGGKIANIFSFNLKYSISCYFLKEIVMQMGDIYFFCIFLYLLLSKKYCIF